ncbi:membrane protein containing DUF1499 [mine drainage metagenome]|uniref:Membrane protein containing DUF1499 n=1 Tax=mine drainage metagenome TaxID=410659 RepID=T1CQZ9_9ZZZZ
MTTERTSKGRKPTVFWLTVIAGVLAFVALALTILPGPFYRIRLLSLGMAFQSITDGAYVGILAMAFGLISAAIALFSHHSRLAMASLIFVIGGLLGFGVPYYWLQKAESVPPIHDITTDPAHPPAFTALLPHLAHIPNTPVYGGGNARARQIERESVIGFATRGEGRRNPEAALVVKNCKTWSPRCLATVQSVYYPDIRPLIFKGRNPTQVYAAALAIMHRRGWTVAFASPGTGRIEAVARTAWFGFKDDVALRIEAVPSGTRVDMRSESRIGLSDIGRNAERVHRFLHALQSYFHE